MDIKIALGLFIILYTCGVYGQDNNIKFVDESATFQKHDLVYFLENFVIPNIQYPIS